MTDIQNSPAVTLTNGAKFIGELMIPGVSLWVDGRVGKGALHTALAVGAFALVGPVGALVVAANSFADSTTEHSLWSHVANGFSQSSKSVVAAVTQAPH